MILTRPFEMATTEITQAQWKAVTGQNPSIFQNCGEACPVEGVDWFSALAYANELSRNANLDECYTLEPTTCADDVSDWADGISGADDDCTGVIFNGLDCTGYRLPTEAEWEYAYRAGTTTAFHNGNMTQPNSFPVDGNLQQIAWYGGNNEVDYDGANTCSRSMGDERSSQCGAHPVGNKDPNDWGLYDMSGNVAEWTWDLYGEYPEPAPDDYAGPGEGGGGSGGSGARVIRAGSWFSLAVQARAATRISVPPSSRGHTSGFRLVRTLPAE